MSNNTKSLRLEKITFTERIRELANSSVQLGYMHATMVVPGALPDGSDLVLGLRDISVKIINGVDKIDFKSKKVWNAEKKKHVWIPVALFPQSAETRATLTMLVFDDPAVVNAVAAATLTLEANAS